MLKDFSGKSFLKMNLRLCMSLASKLDSLGSSVKYSIECALPTSLKSSHDALLPDTPVAMGGSAAVGVVGAPDLSVVQEKGVNIFLKVFWCFATGCWTLVLCGLHVNIMQVFALYLMLVLRVFLRLCGNSTMLLRVFCQFQLFACLNIVSVLIFLTV